MLVLPFLRPVPVAAHRSPVSRHCLAPALVIAGALQALPAQAAPPEASVTLEPLVVVASRYSRAVAQTPASVTVLDADDLAAEGARPLEDILATHAGVTFGRTGGPGQQTGIFLRGNESDGVLVLIDGLRMNGATFDGANLQNLRGADISRIEIVRGPRSTLYGSEAVGGVISISTRRGDYSPAGNEARDEVSLQTEAGSDGSTSLRASALRRSREGHVAFSAGRLRSNGDPIVGALPIEGAHDNTAHTFNASRQFGNTRIGIDAIANAGTTRYADTFAGKPLHQDFLNRSASLWSAAVLDEYWRLDARVGQVEDRIDQQQVAAFATAADYAHTRRLGGSATLRRDGDASTLVLGADAEREQAQALIYGLATRDAADNRAVFARQELQWGRQQFALAARSTDYDSFGSKGTGEASYGVTLSTSAYAWLAAGNGFHAPTSVDRYGYGGNPALRPETSDNLEAGWRQSVGELQFSVTGFRQDIDNLMLCVALPPPSWDCVMQNVASARITGTEVFAGWQHGGTALDAQLTLLDPVDTSTGKQLSRRPAKQLAASARQRSGAFEYRLALLAMSARDNSAYDALQLGGFLRADVGLRWTPHPALSLDARIENVGDVDYALAASSAGEYHMPDRAAFLGIEWRP